jgi:hypothetical protein
MIWRIQCKCFFNLADGLTAGVIQLWDYVFDVKSRPLEAFVPQAVLGSRVSARPNCAG